MPEYIEREAAIKGIMNDAPEQVSYCREDAADCIRYMDAADVAPVRHGRWEEVEDFGGDSHWKCSVCGCEWYFEAGGPAENGSNYCPNCGARMDLHEGDTHDT